MPIESCLELSSIALYYLSIFKMSVDILVECKSIMEKFLGGVEGNGKIA